MSIDRAAKVFLKESGTSVFWDRLPERGKERARDQVRRVMYAWSPMQELDELGVLLGDMYGALECGGNDDSNLADVYNRLRDLADRMGVAPGRRWPDAESEETP